MSVGFIAAGHCRPLDAMGRGLVNRVVGRRKSARYFERTQISIIDRGDQRTSAGRVFSMPDQRESLHPLFRLAALSAAVFIFTIFAMVATVFGDQSTPAARFLNAHAGALISVEVVITLSLTILAMAADRRRTLRNNNESTDDDSQ